MSVGCKAVMSVMAGRFDRTIKSGQLAELDKKNNKLLRFDHCTTINRV